MKKSFAETSPELLRMWDYEKNTFSPYEIGRYENEKIWVKCPVCGNEREVLLTNLHNGTNACNRCRGNEYYFLGKDGTYAVYCHTTPDGKRYIGMTNMPIKTRFGHGKNYSNHAFKEAINQFGWDNVKHEVLEYGLSKEQASEAEEKYISLYNTLNPECGYNIATGGVHGKFLGRKLKDETKEKIRLAHIGMKASDSTRKKLSESHKGIEGTHKRCVIKMDKKGNYLEEYESIILASKENGISCPESIVRVCKGLRKTTGGFRWKYKE